ncbi:uncharacterized protein [Fopius arisanus]|uniref:Uncharacterized protein n=2 Tax=Fopius arisanus TaxID=64838 RepID=A0A9R1TJJ2_9HYME|nr:PREDICTED: uncharacterized protein LOC105270671 [Fopius arisanus]
MEVVMSFCMPYLIFSLVQTSHSTIFPASIKIARIGLSESDFYTTTEGKILKLSRPLAVEDDIRVEWSLQTEAPDYMEVGTYDIIRTEKNISLCHPDLKNVEHRQVFQVFTKILSLDITRGCPIHRQEIVPYRGRIFMNFEYVTDFPGPSCDETDWLLVNLHSPSLGEVSVQLDKLKMSKYSTPLVL